MLGLLETIVSLSRIMIIIMNFDSPVSNTRCHSIGHKMRIARINIRGDSPGRWEIASGGNAIFKRCVLSLERKIGREFEFRVYQEGVNSKVVDQ